MEAALFASDWVKVWLSLRITDADPTSLCHALQRYLHWGWGDARRRHRWHPVPVSALMIRLVSAGELTLATCLLCRHPFVHPADRSPVAASKLCPFCASPHAGGGLLAANQRTLNSVLKQAT